MSTEPASTPTQPLPTTPPNRGNQLAEGLKTIVKAIWFLLSMVIYAVGLVFFYIGKSLITASGWSRPDQPADDSLESRDDQD
jgi:hypothetical protein